jgi:hypothetical protein
MGEDQGYEEIASDQIPTMRQLLFICVLTLTFVSFAQTRAAMESGTSLVFGLSRQEIVLAADSRNLGDYGRLSDRRCV